MRVLLSGTPADAEQQLRAALDEELPPGEAIFTPPVRIVVPTAALQQRLLCRLGSWRPAWPGVRVQTLSSLVLEILDNLGESTTSGDELLPLLVRRLAAAQPALAQTLGALSDGYAGLVPTVQDLRAAGLTVAHVAPLLEAVGEQQDQVTDAQFQRALAAVVVAAQVNGELEQSGTGDMIRWCSKAAAALEADPTVLDTRAVYLFGFAEVSGVEMEVLRALRSGLGATLILLAPGAVRSDRQRRLIEELGAGVQLDPTLGDALDPTWVEAPGQRAELRTVSHRIRALLAAGVRAEEIGVVARELGPILGELHTEFESMGIPWSAVSSGPIPSPPGPTQRRASALKILLERGIGATVDQWLSAMAAPGTEASPAALLLALRRLRCRWLHEVVNIAADGVSAVDVGEGVSGPDLLLLSQRAAETCAFFQPAPPRPASAHRKALVGLVEGPLGWSVAFPGVEPVLSVLRGVGASLPDQLLLDEDSFRLLLYPALARVQSPWGQSLGGQSLGGGGVQVLSAPDARGWSFAALFLIGLNQGGATIEDDALLPDPVRRAMSVVLPDLLPRQQLRRSEQALWASLLQCAPTVTASWCYADAQGNTLLPLRWVARWAKQIERAPPLLSLSPDPAAPDPLWRPAAEHALLAALHGGRDRLSVLLPYAFSERAQVGELESLVAALDLADARLSVIEELDPDLSTQDGRQRRQEPGPYLGFVGVPGGNDPRHRDPSVWALEAISRCPWKFYVESLLVRTIAPLDDGLPELPHRLVRQTARELLKQVVVAAFTAAGRPPPETLEQAHSTAPVLVPWPSPAELDARLSEIATVISHRNGLRLPGFARVIADLARPILEQARLLDWRSGAVSARGADVRGAVQLLDQDGRARRMEFQVDRVDHGHVATNYQVYKTLSDSSVPKTRAQKMLKNIKEGNYLAIPAAAIEAEATGAGRLLCLDPDAAPELCAYEVRADDQDYLSAFRDVWQTTIHVWDQGAFLPRMVDPNKDEEPALCARCEVASACHRGDSSVRGRIERLAERWERQPPAPDSAEKAWWEVWCLPT